MAGKPHAEVYALRAAGIYFHKYFYLCYVCSCIIALISSVLRKVYS